MKVGVYNTANKTDFYRINQDGSEYLALSSGNKYNILINSSNYKNIKNLAQLNCTDDELKLRICKIRHLPNRSILCTPELIEESYNYVEEGNKDPININNLHNQIILASNFNKSRIGSLVDATSSINLSILLNNLSILFPNNKLLVFILSCRG